MKRWIATAVVLALISFIAGTAHAELRPQVKVMLFRLTTVQNIVTGLSLSDFDRVKALAEELAGQAKKAAGAPTTKEPEKTFNQKLSETAAALAAAAAAKNGGETAARLADVLASCYSCHTAVRDVPDKK